jgi:hypothetical protein
LFLLAVKAAHHGIGEGEFVVVADHLVKFADGIFVESSGMEGKGVDVVVDGFASGKATTDNENYEGQDYN